MPALAASVARVSVDIEAIWLEFGQGAYSARTRGARVPRRVAAAYGVAYMAGFRPRLMER